MSFNILLYDVDSIYQTVLIFQGWHSDRGRPRSGRSTSHRAEHGLSQYSPHTAGSTDNPSWLSYSNTQASPSQTSNHTDSSQTGSRKKDVPRNMPSQSLSGIKLSGKTSVPGINPVETKSELSLRSSESIQSGTLTRDSPEPVLALTERGGVPGRRRQRTTQAIDTKQAEVAPQQYSYNVSQSSISRQKEPSRVGSGTSCDVTVPSKTTTAKNTLGDVKFEDVEGLETELAELDLVPTMITTQPSSVKAEPQPIDLQTAMVSTPVPNLCTYIHFPGECTCAHPVYLHAGIVSTPVPELYTYTFP